MSFLVACCFPVSSEGKLLNDSFPPKKQIILTAPEEDHQPLPQEFSRLKYYAYNHVGKLHSLAVGLEERVTKEVQRAGRGNARSRINLLISLTIARGLVSECKADLGLFSHHIISIIDQSLALAYPGKGNLRTANSAAQGVDLELAVRAGALFISWATYSDGAALAADDGASKRYMTVLKRFAGLATKDSVVSGSSSLEKVDDAETRNRTRLIGLAALSAAAESELMSSHRDFTQQAAVIAPALFSNIWLGSVEELKLEMSNAKLDSAPSAYFSEMAPSGAHRPSLAERRAPSLHAHMVGEKGPLTSDVSGAALRALRDLLGQSHASQVITLLQELFSFLDQKGPNSSFWQDTTKACLLVEIFTTFSMLQHRYVVPSTILDQVEVWVEDAPANLRLSTSIEMLTTTLEAPNSLPGLSPTEVLDSILNLIQKRTKIDPQDAIVKALLEAADMLNKHSYYGNQANDLLCLIVQRIENLRSASTPDQGPVIQNFMACLVKVANSEQVSSSASSPNPENAAALSPPLTLDVGVLAGSSQLQTATSLSERALYSLLSGEPKVETPPEAVSTLGPIRVTVDGVEKDNNKPTIMLNSNGSMRSFQTAGERGVDLNDLREALGGRSGAPSLRAPSLASHASYESLRGAANGNGAARVPKKKEDVKGILQDLLKDKKPSKPKARTQAGHLTVTSNGPESETEKTEVLS